MRILFVASEALPYAKTGGLADVIEALPRALTKLGHEVAVFLPQYRGIEPTSIEMASMTVPQGTRLRFPAITNGGIHRGVRYFFLDDPFYFNREGLYGDRNREFPDNAERFTEFSRAAIELAKQIWLPDLIHCHDWQTAMVPVLLRTSYGDDPAVRDIPVVFTIHNMGYHGIFSRDALDRAGIPTGVFHPGGIEFFGNINFLKGGLVYSDYLTTVSRRYAEEIQTPEFGFGLEGVVRTRASRLTGILNGVEYSEWSPERDKLILARYSAKDMAGKRVCKQALLDEFKLMKDNPNRPVIGIVSRFADQKGFDLIAKIVRDLLHEDVLIAVLGTGDRRYEELFRALAADLPGKLGAVITYDNRLAHVVEAGADIFLMPSRYEPCGLNQIYSLRYGTVPVVRATGGLDDTIESFDLEHGTGTGFKFWEYSSGELLHTIRLALHYYSDEGIWKRIQLNGMAKDFSWNTSAAEYAKLYEAARAARNQSAVPSSN
ncbi:MAG TPA: glycogen synthase GlgA [Candidatus Eremiobacteraceae bacterium]|nr:glycogen synthase GlgA [Candidatus Eremiobacteraceae bacterium]